MSPRLAPQAIHIWRIAVDSAGAEVRSFFGVLAPDEQARAERFRSSTDQVRFAASRAGLRQILSEYTGLAAVDLLFSYTPQGKPVLASPASPIMVPNLQFSLSHAGSMALVAVTQGRAVGVDVEGIRSMSDADAIAERFFSLAERQMLRALPPTARTAGFFACWTRKEAYLKARGKGLSVPLSSFDVTVDPAEPARLLGIRHDPDAEGAWDVRDVPVPSGYAAAVAAEGTRWDVVVRDWRPRSAER